MKYRIDSDILNKTTECTNYFSCLFGRKDCCCDVKESINIDREILYIEPVNNDLCNYRMPHGSSWLCNCPTRIAIYKEYGT